MNAASLAAVLYALLALAPIGVQAALAFGAPLGHLTMGGRFPGRLPLPVRAIAAGQGLILAVMALATLDAGGILALGAPGWTAWAIVALTAMTAFANTVTPSRPERRLWMPVTLAMVACALVVALAAR